ncbi:hypothetical protein ES677_12160 [Bizionia gelidisalsuginis]|uniref:Uncharacterized protein n=1 Tax=Bizionia gelidisalsuginis TaxID=291188 RepID=A0ABY3M898_9FLAO|nr:hypothetical protein [Bizionia gelidisalsuginis]TYC10118.1 hypothetical protein ES677_12160 [Bizionia gelidisalsuginis]
MKIENNSLEFCKLTFYEYYVVSIIKEGIVLTSDLSLKITAVILNFYQDKPFVYITDRKNNYSVDPLIYKRTSQATNLLAFCIVTQNHFNESNVEIERLFLKKPLKVLTSVVEAKNWATLIYNNYLLNETN